MLPDFNPAGDLPPGVYRTTLAEILTKFGATHGRRAWLARRLEHIYELARYTGCLDRLVIFGSFVTDKSEPNDIDVILVMKDDFRLEECPSEARGLFDHAIAQARFGASIFWIRPALLIGDNVDSFVAHWQVKRDGSRRGIVEVAG